MRYISYSVIKIIKSENGSYVYAEIQSEEVYKTEIFIFNI